MSDYDENIHPANAEPRGDLPGDGVDLLVDGELSESDRRALLLQLEHEPDGWRRCALAFLEAQCWKAELGQVVPPAAPARAVPASQAEPIEQRQSWRQYAATTLAMSASFLIALVVVHGWSGGSHSPDSLLKTVVDETPLASPQSARLPDLAPGIAALPAVPATPAMGSADD